MWSPFAADESKPAAARRLSPQDKGVAARKKQDTDADVDMDAWVGSDDGLRALDADVSVDQDIDWLAHDDVELSLGLDFAPHADVDVDVGVDGFGFGASPFWPPLRGDLPDIASIVEPVASLQKDAEKLLMSFDTMRSFTIPSPTSASSRKKRAGLFGRGAQDSPDTDFSASMTAGSSLTVSVPAAGEELHKEQARARISGGLSITAPDAFLGTFGSSSTMSSSGLPERKIGSYSPQARKLRIQKFHEKRKNRTWKKSIKYDCRKKLADDRPRIKGRFVRVLENGDDKDEAPSTPTDSSSPKVLSGFPSPKSPSGAPPASPDASEVCSVMPASPTPSSPTSVGMSSPSALSCSSVGMLSAIASV